jgi:taurine dioxygenase
MGVLEAPHTQPSGTFDNRAKHYRHLEALPLSSAMGAEIRGVDLRELDDAQFSELEDALYHHKMLYLRDQKLAYSDQEELTLRFGSFGVDAYTAGIDGHPHLQRVIKQAEESAPMIFGGNWHTDSPFLERPPALSLLYGVDIPPYGGDTWWANTQLAYESLSPAMRQILQPLQVMMSARKVLAGLRKHSPDGGGVKVTSMDIDVKERTLIEGALHPMIRTHPATGDKSLYIDPTYTVGIEGLSAYEAGPLVDFLCAHITQPIFCCRLRWEPGTFAMWDNRGCIHHAFNDHDGFRREMLRTIVEGEVPV